MKKINIKSDEIMKSIRSILIFQSLSDEQIKELEKICEVFEYSKGEVIVTQDTVSPLLYGILSGKVDIFVKSENKEDIYISQVSQGDIFGEAAIFLDMTRTANVEASTTVQILTITRKNLIKYINKIPQAGLKIFTYIIFSLLHKLKNANRELAFEKESAVTAKDIINLEKFFPKTLAQIIHD
ncbi:MAG: cyclic nucleotide-binding domain-containing protein [Spirochaetales bacterium]|nr:cyclic nucleotide-binding domain-containing protein [Spirochaetales bacterium]